MASIELRDDDVISGRSLHARNHAGNHRLTGQISQYYEAYAIGSKSEKIEIIKTILEYMSQYSCRFVKKRRGKWLQIDERSAREKIGQMLREMYTQSKAPPDVEKSSDSTQLQFGSLALVQEYVFQDLIKKDVKSGISVTGSRDRIASTDSTVNTSIGGLESSEHSSEGMYLNILN